MIAKEPGFLLARAGYLAELYNACWANIEEALKRGARVCGAPRQTRWAIRGSRTWLRGRGIIVVAVEFAAKAIAYDPDSWLRLRARALSWPDRTTASSDGRRSAVVHCRTPRRRRARRAHLGSRLGRRCRRLAISTRAEKLVNQSYGLAKDASEWRTRARARSSTSPSCS